MASSKQMKMTDYLPKPKTPIYNSVVENFYLTSPAYREARWATKIVEHAPWGFIGEVAAYGTGSSPDTRLSDPNMLKEKFRELFKEKYDARKVDEAIEKGWEAAKPYSPGFMGTSAARVAGYRAFAYAEKLLVNPGWKGNYMNESPPIPVTLEDKHLAGIYTQADTNNIERIKTRELQDTMVESHGLTGLFGGRKSRKSKKTKSRKLNKRRTIRRR